MQKIIQFSTLVFIFGAFFIINETIQHNYASALLNLTGNDINWQTRNYAQFNQTSEDLRIDVNTVDQNEIYNRMYTVANFSGGDSNPVLNFTYATNATEGNPRFIFESITNISENDASDNSPFLQYKSLPENVPKKFATVDLGNTLGYFTNRTIELPSHIVNSTSEYRFYIITNGTTIANLELKNATIS